MKKRLTIIMFSFLLLLISNKSEAAYDLVSQERISAGVVKNEYRVTGDGNHYANVLICDLTNPYIKLDVIAGAGRYTERATVTQMAQRTGANAVVNGDFFNMNLQGAPNGPSIVDGDIKSSPCALQGVYSLGIDQNNTGHIVPVGFGGYLGLKSGRIYPIDGLNKSYYWYEPNLEYSHEDRIQVYTDFWASSSRGWDKCSEILISSDGIVEEISYGKNLDYAVPTGKKIIQVHGQAKDFVRDSLFVGDYVSLDYNLSPEIDWKFLIGGHALLVDNGEVVPYTKDLGALEGNRARTAAGISQDGKTMYIVSVEGRTSRSEGMRLAQLSRFMKAIGSFRALNLDGGGSTAMVVNKGGSLNRVVNPERDGSERRVVNGIGVFSTAIPGQIVRFDISGPDSIVVGETAYYGLGNAWDGNENMVSTEGIEPQISAFDNSLGNWSGNSFKAHTPGNTNFSMTVNGVESNKTINILDSSHIEGIAVNLSQRRVEQGETIYRKLLARTSVGRVIELEQSDPNWALNGFSGDINLENSEIYISNLNGLREGDISLSFYDKLSKEKIYDKKTNLVEMHIGSRKYKVNETEKEMDVEPILSNARTMVPVRFLVEALGGEVEWDPQTLTVLIDYAGTNIQIPVGDNNINIDGHDQHIDSPAILYNARTMVPIRFIVEALKMDIDYRGIDQRVTIIDENPVIDKISKLQMNIGSRFYYIDQSPMEMDVELFTVNGRTMVPVRFVVEGMKGNVDWNEDKQTVIIDYEGKKIEVPIGSNEISVDGRKVRVDSPAILRDSRSFVPIRFIAESLGMKVGYRPLDQRVTIVRQK